MSTICNDLRAAVLQALIPDPDKCPERNRDRLVKLSDLPLTYMRGNGLRKNDIIENGSKKCVLYGELFTKHTEGVIEEDNLSRTNVSSNVLSKSGDILIPGTSTASKEVMLRARELYVDGVQIGGDINIIRPNADLFYPKYMSYVFDTFSSKRQLFEYITGTTGIIHISNSGIKNLVFYLPPIEEQKRIVEKIDELMARVADLEQSADALASLKKAFTDDIRASLLQAAMQGKLTKQLPEDGSAEDLLKEIKSEKEKPIVEGKIKRQKPLAPITDDEIPFSIPDNWKWVHWGDIINVVSARRVHQSDWRKNGIPFYRAREIGKLADYGFVDNDLFISEELFKEYSKSGLPRKNDLMVTAVGTLGKTYVVQESDKFYYKDASVLCFENYHCDPYFLKYLMDSDIIKNQIESNSGGTTVGTLTIVRMNDYILPLPPLAEQKRISERLDTLMQNINVVGDLIASE